MMHFLRIAAVVVVAAGLAACAAGSPKTRFYTLSPLSEASPVSVPVKIFGTIGVGPIVLPDYLDRQEIVLPTTQYRRDLAVFEQWVEPLRANMTRTLAENVAVLLGGQTVYGFPWSSSLRVDTQILVDVVQFDGLPGKDATLVARWTVVSGESRKVLASRRVKTTVPVGGETYDALAAALSQSLATFSRDIVNGLLKAAD